MMSIQRTAGLLSVLLLAGGLMLTPSASGQRMSYSAGPQITTLGVGVSASARFTDLVGVSVGYNLFPLQSTEKEGFGNSIAIEPALQGGLFLVTLHPTGGKFAIGGGIQAGGMSADALLSLDPNSGAVIELGSHEYPASGVGDLIGTFEYGSSVQPSFLIGWVGPGFNLALGASLATPTLELQATGPLKNDAQFQADLKMEIEEFDDTAGQVPVYPYFSLGWQFSF